MQSTTLDWFSLRAWLIRMANALSGHHPQERASAFGRDPGRDCRRPSLYSVSLDSGELYEGVTVFFRTHPQRRWRQGRRLPQPASSPPWWRSSQWPLNGHKEYHKPNKALPHTLEEPERSLCFSTLNGLHEHAFHRAGHTACKGFTSSREPVAKGSCESDWSIRRGNYLKRTWHVEVGCDAASSSSLLDTQSRMWQQTTPSQHCW